MPPFRSGSPSWLAAQDWPEKSGFTRDPKTLEPGETVGVPNRPSAPSTPQNQPAGSPATQNTAPTTGGTSSTGAGDRSRSGSDGASGSSYESLFENTGSSVNSRSNVLKTWWDKPDGAKLTEGEARLQIAIGSYEMVGGFVGGLGLSVLVENPVPFYIGTFFMGDGVVLINDGLSLKKRTPLIFGLSISIPWPISLLLEEIWKDI